MPNATNPPNGIPRRSSKANTGAAGIIRPVSAPLLIGETARVLRELIVHGRLQPGERIRERELGAQLGVSRTPLREALLLLATERMVDLSPRRSARVALLDAATVEDVFPVLTCIERLAADLACRQMSAERLEALRVLGRKLKAARVKRDSHRFLELSQRFHDIVLEAAGNATLRATHEHLSGQVRRARFMSLQADREWAEALREHERLLAALESRNAAAAVKAVAKRLAARKKSVLRRLDHG